MPDIALTGCTPEPLMNYLKALGIFRLVAEQADSEARLSWSGGVAHLSTALDHDGLARFFLEAYEPTPIVGPWNGGSGFYEGGSAPLDAIARSTVDRLTTYRSTINQIRTFVPKSKPKDTEKASLLTRCRAELADVLVPWLDACFVLGEDGPAYFPLLGTGGNDGRLEFTNNFMQRLADAIPFAEEAQSTSRTTQLLRSSLFDDALPELTKSAVGQFNPGGIGGPNGTQGKFEAASAVNPWDFILMIEGALLLAGAVARRLGSTALSRSVFPFTVETVAVGYGSSATNEETRDGSRAEIWLPLWSNPTSFEEAKHLFAEGRAQLGRRQASNAVEFALAVNLLGIDRGIGSFTRYGLLKRNGLAFLAAPIGRILVTHRPQARLLDDPPLVSWIDRLRAACRDKNRTPVRYQSALRHIDRSMYEFAVRSERGNDPKYLLEVLRALGSAERTMADGLAFCEDKHIRPMSGLSPQWLIDAAPSGDAGREFRLAASLASIMAERKTELGGLRTHLEPVVQASKWVNWSPGSTSAVWSRRPLAENLSAVLVRRLMESDRAGVSGCALRARVFAPLNDVIAFIDERTDDEALADLLWGLIGLDWNSNEFRRRSFRRQQAEMLHSPGVTPVPAAFGLIRLTLTQLRLAAEPARNRVDGEDRWRVVTNTDLPSITTTPRAAPFLALAGGDVARAELLAARRLWSDRIVPFGWTNRQQRARHHSEFAADPTRLLAACLFPLSSPSLSRLARQSLSPPLSVD
ncbi:MAG: type I-U CRISPR-associated protein Csx17 [Planctomycetaceae bacterium]